MSYRKFVGDATAEGRLWVGGVEWNVEIEFYADDSDLRIHRVYFVGWYDDDRLTKVDPIPCNWTDWSDHNQDQLESAIDLWLQEYGYE
jgi:hypothetical protein